MMKHMQPFPIPNLSNTADLSVILASEKGTFPDGMIILLLKVCWFIMAPDGISLKHHQ